MDPISTVHSTSIHAFDGDKRCRKIRPCNLFPEEGGMGPVLSRLNDGAQKHLACFSGLGATIGCLRGQVGHSAVLALPSFPAGVSASFRHVAHQRSVYAHAAPFPETCSSGLTWYLTTHKLCAESRYIIGKTGKQACKICPYFGRKRTTMRGWPPMAADSCPHLPHAPTHTAIRGAQAHTRLAQVRALACLTRRITGNAACKGCQA